MSWNAEMLMMVYRVIDEKLIDTLSPPFRCLTFTLISCKKWALSVLPCRSHTFIKVSSFKKQIVKPWIQPKYERMNSFLLLRSFFGRNWRLQKGISKLTDLFLGPMHMGHPMWRNYWAIDKVRFRWFSFQQLIPMFFFVQ